VNRVITFGDIVDQQLPMLLREFRQHAGADRAGSVSAESGVQHGGCRTNAADGSDLLDRQIGVLARECVSLRVADQYLRQRPDLHGFAVEARGFDPGIFLLAVPAGEGGLGLSHPRMQRLLSLIVGVHHVCAD